MIPNKTTKRICLYIMHVYVQAMHQLPTKMQMEIKAKLNQYMLF